MGKDAPNFEDVTMNLFSTNAYGHAEPTRHAANADPDTSHEAAINMEVSGKLNRHCEIVLGIIRRQPGTYPELWEAATPEEKADAAVPSTNLVIEQAIAK